MQVNMTLAAIVMPMPIWFRGLFVCRLISLLACNTLYYLLFQEHFNMR
jgi:hypothetical protein